MMKDALQTIAAEVLEDFDLAREAAADGTYVRTFLHTYCCTVHTYIQDLKNFEFLIFI